jgi:hypothetical protein
MHTYIYIYLCTNTGGDILISAELGHGKVDNSGVVYVNINILQNIDKSHDNTEEYISENINEYIYKNKNLDYVMYIGVGILMIPMLGLMFKTGLGFRKKGGLFTIKKSKKNEKKLRKDKFLKIKYMDNDNDSVKINHKLDLEKGVEEYYDDEQLIDDHSRSGNTFSVEYLLNDTYSNEDNRNNNDNNDNNNNHDSKNTNNSNNNNNTNDDNNDLNSGDIDYIRIQRFLNTLELIKNEKKEVRKMKIKG